MRRWTMFAALLAGCYQPAAEATCSVHCPSGVCPSGMTCGADQLCRSSPTDDCTPIDDGGVDGDKSKICFGTALVHDFCITPPSTSLQFTTPGTLSTAATNCDATMQQTDGSTLCFFIGTTILISANLRVTGPNAAVFLGTQDVTITAQGVLDVSSKAPELVAGAGGADAGGCTSIATLAGSPDPAFTAGGGGAGGSFIGSAGVGGSGNNGSATIAGGPRGSVIGKVATVRGGCPGGSGGNGMANGSGSLGGYAGGAVYLLSGGLVRVTGKINASGSGGWQPKATGGAGGGGSGGFIGFDAPTYDFVNGQIWAVGGSGAAGAAAGGPGVAGLEATGPASPGTTSSGGTAGAGGAGGSFAAGGDGQTATLGGGGGGGGSCGYVGVANLGQLPGGSFAPMPVAMN